MTETHDAPQVHKDDEDEPIEITLTWDEVAVAAEVGSKRHIASVTKGDRNAHGYDGADSWTVNIEGACAELAVAKALVIPWDGGINTYKAADVSNNIQVRWTPSHGNKLIVRDSDSDDHYYVLVTGTAPTYRIHGYKKGRSAKFPNWLQAPNGRPAAYFVPQGSLRPISTALVA